MEQKTQARTERYDPQAIEKKWQERWAADGLYDTDLYASRRQVLLPDDAPVHLGRPARRPLVRDGAFRRRRALQADERQERLLPDRLRRLRAAGGERGDQARHPPARLDVRQHRPHARPAEDAWARCSTGSTRRSPPTRSSTAGTSGSSSRCTRRGLAYRKMAPANWCPNDQTVLANEQVVNGACERCGTRRHPERPGAVVLPHPRLRRGAAGLHATWTGPTRS